MSNDKLNIAKAARRQGVNPGRLHELGVKEYTALAVGAMGTTELLVNGAKVVSRLAKNAVNYDVVPDEVAEARLHACATRCPIGAYLVLADGEPACDKCKCAGKRLRGKVRGRKASCPAPEPAWGTWSPPERREP